MKVIIGLVAILIVLFVGGFVFSGMTAPQVTQTEISKDIDLKSLETATPTPALAPATTPAPVIDVSETPVAPAPAPVTPPPATTSPTPATTNSPNTNLQGE